MALLEVTGHVEPLPWLPGVGIFAFLLALMHLAAPTLRRHLSRIEPTFASFGGGMAVTYVFTHLLPELDRAHADLGRMIFAVALLAFLVYYVVGTRLHGHQHDAGGPAAPGRLYGLKLTHLFIYNWLIVFGMPLEVEEVGLRSLAVALALMLHLAHGDFGLGEESPTAFDRRGRFILALAPPAGWVSALAVTKSDESVNDLFVAILAGSLLYNIFRDELPGDRRARLWPFLAGVAIFFVLTVGAVD